MIVLTLLLLLADGTVQGHSLTELKPCQIPQVTEMEEKQLVGAGFDLLSMKYWRTFDIDGDKRPDYHVEYNISGIREDKSLILSTFPNTYYYDRDKDGVYEEVWVDMLGNGRCRDLKPYIGRQHGGE